MVLEKYYGSYQNYNLSTLTKEDLIRDANLAVALARENKNFGTHLLAQDLNILGLNNGEVAKELALNSKKNGWGRTNAARNPKVRELADGEVDNLLGDMGIKGKQVIKASI